MATTEKVTKERIVRAVLDSAFAKSVGGTSLADISERLGIKKASLYNHYESRDAMIADTIAYCGDTLRRTHLIPADMATAAQKYPAETVLKGIAGRWLRLHEKEPLLQVSVFLESEKYFSNQAAVVVREARGRLIAQSAAALKSLAEAQKIMPLDDALARQYATLFVGVLRDLLDVRLTDKKERIRSNPETGADTLFAESADEPDLAETEHAVEQFCALLKRS